MQKGMRKEQNYLRGDVEEVAVGLVGVEEAVGGAKVNVRQRLREVRLTEVRKFVLRPS